VDSATANPGTLRKVEQVPARLLRIGLPLTTAPGVATGYFIFDSLTLPEIITVLRPTLLLCGQTQRQ
jgi:hypothetical protein